MLLGWTGGYNNTHAILRVVSVSDDGAIMFYPISEVQTVLRIYLSHDLPPRQECSIIEEIDKKNFTIVK